MADMNVLEYTKVINTLIDCLDILSVGFEVLHYQINIKIVETLTRLRKIFTSSYESR